MTDEEVWIKFYCALLHQNGPAEAAQLADAALYYFKERFSE